MSNLLDNLTEKYNTLINQYNLYNTEKNISYITQLSYFNSKDIPKISIKDYLIRIKRYSKCTNECLISSYIHLNYLINKKELILTYFNIHRLLLISIMVCTKFYEDEYYDNKMWSSIGGISLSELNTLEIVYCQLIEYKLYISSFDFKKYEDLLL